MAENQRDNILNYTSDMMCRTGIRSISIDDICHELGMSKKTFYVYFSTKEELVDELLRKHEREIRKEIERKTKGVSILNLTRNLHQSLHSKKDVSQIPPLLYDLQKYYPMQLRGHLERSREIFRELFTDCLQRGVEEGLFRTDIDVLATGRVLASLHQIMCDKMSQAKNHPTIVSDSKMTMDIFMRGLVTAEGLTQILEHKDK